MSKKKKKIKDPVYRSKFERAIHEHATGSGRVAEYEPDGYYLNYTVSSRYIPDFRLPNGILVEAKGYLRSTDRSKMRRVKACNSGLDIRFVFMNASKKISKAPSSLTYGEWADKNGFPWAEGLIPEEWYEERSSATCEEKK